MLKTKIAMIARLMPALAMLSCAAPKAIVVEVAPSPKQVPPVETAAADLPLPPDDGLRVPDMLIMPGDGDFRATSPNTPKKGTEAGTVTVRPPTDPPSRPKLKPAQEDESATRKP